VPVAGPPPWRFAPVPPPKTTWGEGRRLASLAAGQSARQGGRRAPGHRRDGWESAQAPGPAGPPPWRFAPVPPPKTTWGEGRRLASLAAGAAPVQDVAAGRTRGQAPRGCPPTAPAAAYPSSEASRSLPQSVLGEGQARSARVRARGARAQHRHPSPASDCPSSTRLSARSPNHSPILRPTCPHGTRTVSKMRRTMWSGVISSASAS
jgi:hypothetical protein